MRTLACIAGLAVLAACSQPPAARLSSPHPWLDNGGAPIAISHEGIRNADGEITLDGFIEAYDMGFRYIETDLRLLASGELVALHDITGGTESKTLTEIRNGAPIAPTATELLTDPRLDGAKWNFELKGGDATTAAALTRVLNVTGAAPDVCVSLGTTVRPSTVMTVRDALPSGLCTCASILERATDWGVFVGMLRWADLDERVACTQQAAEPGALGQVFQVGASDVRQAHRRGLAIHVYDLFGIEMTPSDVEFLLDAGVDGIITDDHVVVKQVFEQRGIWPAGP